MALHEKIVKGEKMNNIDKMLPKKIDCPNCGVRLVLEEKERKDHKFICPECNSKTILNSGIEKEFSTVNTELPKKIDCPSCGVRLVLEEKERKGHKFICPECKNVFDMSLKEFQDTVTGTRKETTVPESNSTNAIDAPPNWKVLFLGMFRPAMYMRLSGSSPSGVAHFYRTFSLYCLLPVVILNLLAIAAEKRWPDAWYFQDINPWTIIIAVPAQLIIGPLNIWIIAWCFYAGMNVVGLNPAHMKDRVLTTGWYVGTTLLCLGYWWLGFGIFFSSIDSIQSSFEPILTAGLWVGIFIWIWVALSAYHVNVPVRSGDTGTRVFFGLVIGALLFFLAMIPIGFVLQFVVVGLQN
jgi:DNA-directed RNA polymerase subunit M/transcription elongation factor TFIIS